MIQIIKENIDKQPRRQSFLEGLGGLASSAINAGANYYMKQEQQQAQAQKMQQENEMIKNLTGNDLSGIQDPKIRQMAVQLALQGQQKEKEMGINAEQAQRMQSQKSMDQFNQAQELQYQKAQQQKELEGIRQQGKQIKAEKPKDISGLKSALKTLNTMKELRSKGNLGIGSTYSPFPSTREDAAKYSQLGKSLIQMGSNIPIRNRQEFEVLAHDLYNPNLTDAAAKGILDAMEQIVKQGIEEGEKPQHEDVSILDNISDEEIQKLVEESGGDVNVAKKIALQRYSR